MTRARWGRTADGAAAPRAAGQATRHGGPAAAARPATRPTNAAGSPAGTPRRARPPSPAGSRLATAATLVATMVGVAGLGRLASGGVTGPAWWPLLLPALAGYAAAALALRARSAPSLAAVAGTVAAAVAAGEVAVVRATGSWVPGGAAGHAVTADLRRAGGQLTHATLPLHAGPGLALLGGLVAGLAAVAARLLLGAPARLRPAAALLPGLALVAWSCVAVPGAGAAVLVAAFALPAAATLAVASYPAGGNHSTRDDGPSGVGLPAGRAGRTALPTTGTDRAGTSPTGAAPTTTPAGTGRPAGRRPATGGLLVGLAAAAAALAVGLPLAAAGSGAPDTGGSGSGSSSGSYPVPATTLSLETALLRVERQDAHELLFTARTAVPTYWQVGVLATWRDGRWVPGPDGSVAGTPARRGTTPPRGDSGSPVTSSVTVANLASRLLPVPPSTFRVTGAAGATFTTAGVLAPAASRPGERYRATWLATDPADTAAGTTAGASATAAGTPTGGGTTIASTAAAGTSAGPGAATVAGAGDAATGLAPYLALPAVPAEVRALARQVTAGAASPLAQAEDLVNWFRSGAFRYTLTPPAPPPGTDPLVEFLTTDRAGSCQSFAGAFAVMARTLGLPARVAVGFTAGTAGGSGITDVTGADAHAWPEVYVGSAGWVSFEPTPAGAAGAGTAPPSDVVGRTTPAPPPTTPLATTPTTEPTTSATPSTATTTPPAATTPSPTTATAPAAAGGGSTWWPAALAATLVGLALAALLAVAGPHLVRRRRRTRWSPARRVGAACRSADRSLRRAGAGRPPHRTPLAHAHHLLAAAGQLAGRPRPTPAAGQPAPGLTTATPTRSRGNAPAGRQASGHAAAAVVRNGPPATPAAADHLLAALDDLAALAQVAERAAYAPRPPGPAEARAAEAAAGRARRVLRQPAVRRLARSIATPSTPMRL